jgi:putative membrane protein
MLTPEDREKVRAAVAKAEAGLTAEIVPCVYAQSSPYPESIWAGAGAGMSLAVAALFLLDVFHPLWMPLSRLILWVPAGGLAGAALGRWCGPARRALIGGRRMEAAVARRAKEVFFDRGIARTTGRDGVLIFASLLERRVVVLADEAVRAKASPAAWDAAVAAMTAHAADGRVADGLVAAVEKTAEALTAAGFSGKPASGNELGDEPLEGGDE